MSDDFQSSTTLISSSLKDVENVELIARDETTISGRLKSLVDCTADDIKMCANVCDTYIKKRTLAKVRLRSIWDAKFLEFKNLFVKRRREFELELSIYRSLSVDRANAKLDTIWNKTHDLNEKFLFLYFSPDGVLNSDVGWTSCFPCFSNYPAPRRKKFQRWWIQWEV